MKKKKPNKLILFIFLVGLGIFMYPIIGNITNKIKNTIDIYHFEQSIVHTENVNYDEYFEEARKINTELPGKPKYYDEDSSFYQEYSNALSLGNGMMGYLVINKIDVHLPIYHGTGEDVLQKAIGYLEGTHLPTGDIGNSTVLTGHTGLPSAELLTNLDQLEVGDHFKLAILDRVFTYEVFDINVVLPNEVDLVAPREGMDMVTLVTCTPYGVNSHRLLVHGKQIFTGNQVVETDSKTFNLSIETLIKVWIGLLIAILIVLILKALKKH